MAAPRAPSTSTRGVASCASELGSRRSEPRASPNIDPATAHAPERVAVPVHKIEPAAAQAPELDVLGIDSGLGIDSAAAKTDHAPQIDAPGIDARSAQEGMRVCAGLPLVSPARGPPPVSPARLDPPPVFLPPVLFAGAAVEPSSPS